VRRGLGQIQRQGIIDAGYEILIEIAPSRVAVLDQPKLPRTPPFLDLALTSKGDLAGVMLLKPNEDRDAILGSEPLTHLFSVLVDTLDDVVGRARVDRAVALAGDDVGVEHGRPKFPRRPYTPPLIPAKAGTQIQWRLG